MAIANSFPVFEPDQVLTNKHLNDLFNYLYQQDRMTRCKLLGSGIVCGLDISYSPGVINISKGCGLTSQGFVILFCDHMGQNGYKYYIPYTKPAFPNDLKLIIQCGPEPDHNNIPFFSGASATSENFEDDGIFLLLTQDDYNALTDNSKAVTLSQASLGDYAVVLFLEANELSLKNCDTNDCNDKGSLMDFEIRPLLVNKKSLGSGGSGGNGKPFQNVELRRYNVPVKNLNTADDVLNAFVALLDDQTLSQLSDDLILSYDQYGYLLTGNHTATNPFGKLADFKKDIQSIIQNRPFLIQYYYDFIYDLILALTEFRRRSWAIVGECCGDEMKFPFHLTLGEADQDTVSNGISAYRQYFIYSPLFDVEGGKSGELRSLLTRLILMYQDFLLSVRTSPKKSYSLPQEIKITPSNYSHSPLSERCIPYYYKVVHDDADTFPQDLYYYWDFDKTKRGDAKLNLCYDPTPYNNANTVVNPLYYDIERYNFFRVEGHIGKNINAALPSVVSIKQNMNLPFDVVALSADYIGALLSGNDPVCCIQDLESDYRILIAGFICALHDLFCYAGKPAFRTDRILSGADLFGAEASLTTRASAKKATADTAKAADTEMLSMDAVGLITDHPFISGLVNEYQSTGSYVKGDTLSRLCTPAVNTIGGYYISSVKSAAGKFTNPVSSNATGAANVLNYHLFEFLDSVESMFGVMMTKDLSLLDTGNFKTLYSRFANEVNFIGTTKLGTLVNLQMILHTCIVEKLEALKNEYLRRVAQYRLARNFNYYFKKHGGIEHKAGVPRGGSFILVYHEERKNRFVDLRSLFVNKELSNVLLSNFRELLNPDVNLNTQEAKTKMLAVSLLYKDPDLYMRFKDVMQQYLDDCTNLPPDTKTTITGIINQPPSKQTFTLEDGMVIADFYVPYMCCSDCPPIAYILPTAATTTTQNPPLQKTLSVCGDLKQYALEPNLKSTDTVKIISNADGLKLKDSLVAMPSSSTNVTKTFQLSYQVNDQQTDLTLTVAVPVADFTINFTQIQENNENFLVLQLESKDKNNTTSQWNITPLPIGLTNPIPDDPLKNARITPGAFKEATNIHIDHAVAIRTDSGSCKITASYDLPIAAMAKALKKKDFDNQTKF